MTSPRPKLVLFDLGNVLVHIHPEAFLQTLGLDTPDNRRYYQPRITGIVKRYERGDDSTEQFLTNVDALFNARESEQQYDHGAKRVFSREEFRLAMLTVVGQPIEGMEELVKHVAASVAVGLLSNTNPLHYDLCKNTLRVLHFIPHHFLSYQLKSLKPEPKIFERVIDRLHVEPIEVLYIDDVAENVNAARAFGLNGYEFVGPKELRYRLAELRLI